MIIILYIYNARSNKKIASTEELNKAQSKFGRFGIG